MFNTKGSRRLLILSLILCVSAMGQEPTTQKEIRQVDKVRKMLAQYDIGTKLDVRLSDGTQQTGTLTETEPAAFVLVDSVSSKSQTVAYLQVKRVKPSGNRQFGKSRGIRYPAVDLVLISLALLTILVVK
jgi:hypothetical protein